MASGKLRIYLGAAPGVGKTYAMLAEAQRRLALLRLADRVEEGLQRYRAEHGAVGNQGADRGRHRRGEGRCSGWPAI